MKAYLIDPKAREIREVENPAGWPSEAMHEAIQWHDEIACSGVDRVGLERRGDSLWVDGEGHFIHGAPVFFVDGYPAALAGRGLVLGLDPAGENAEPRRSLAEIQDLVHWTDLVATGEFTPVEQIGEVMNMGWPILEPDPATWAALDHPGARFSFRVEGQFVRLADECPLDRPSVTNDAEGVIRVLQRFGVQLDDSMVLYSDSAGEWDALLTKNGKFSGFMILRGASFEEARAKIVAQLNEAAA